MGLLNEIEKVFDEFCNKYCRYRAEMESASGELSDEATEQLFEKHCSNCPVVKL